MEEVQQHIKQAGMEAIADVKGENIHIDFVENMLAVHKKYRDSHPERPERIMAIYLNLVKKGLFSQLVEIDSDIASEEDLLLVHKPLHIRHVKTDAENLKHK